MRKICAKITKVLTDHQKRRRASACEDLLQRVEKGPGFLENVITGDESWFFEYDPETKRQCSSFGSNEQIQSESHFLIFFDAKGVVHYEFVPKGQTMNGVCYLEVPYLLQGGRLIDAKRRRDDAPTPYSPDLAPADFSLIPKVKSSLKGHHHWTLSAVKEACTSTLKDLPESSHQGAFESWKSRCQKCIDAQRM
ncbi:hypothetical protein NQ318_009494 [Aromia moschata]|uniref:Mariner Mos1 transposase n=1 Tax=Aromia moschata TaxID=1265417 RepID=A0AAV8Z779_9CUCU|nr:hypothetical protein NQ318_009494 [Aromia moschata]